VIEIVLRYSDQVLKLDVRVLQRKLAAQNSAVASAAAKTGPPGAD
jgi:hypothetical protein